MSKIYRYKIFLYFSLFFLISSKKVDDNDETQLLEGIIQAMKDLKISYESMDDVIDQKIYIKLLKHLVLNDADSFGILSNSEDSFLLKLSREVNENIPEKIKIKELPKYLNPRLIEPLINKILSEFDLNSMIKNLGDTFGITDTIKKKMEEYEKKDIEREKINQARIKRKQEREKEQSQINKNPKRDLRNNISEENIINKDL